MLDTVAGANMVQGAGVSYTSDRFGIANGALSLNGGWAQVPAGIFFNTPQFTISVWIYPQQVGSWSRLLDFGNGFFSDNIIFTIDQYLNSKPTLQIVQGTTPPSGFSTSSIGLVSNQWQFLVGTFDGSTASIYINGILTASVPLVYSLNSINRVNNYIGRSCYGSDGYSYSYIDDLKFYSISLSASQVNDQFLKDGQYKSISLNLYGSLTNYWPIINSQMNDYVGCADMTQGSLTTFSSDRFGNLNASLNLNGGWNQVPSGIYFNSPQFTITVWIYPSQVGANAKILDFGNGASLYNIDLSQSSSTSNSPYILFYDVSTNLGAAISSIALTLNQWQFLAVSFDGSLLSIYLNGILTQNQTIVYTLPTLVRTNNYIGKSPWSVDGYSYSYLDDLRFYNISLTQSQINDLINAIDGNLIINACTTTSTTSTTTTSTTSTSTTTTTSITQFKTLASSSINAITTSSLLSSVFLNSLQVTTMNNKIIIPNSVT